MSTDSVRLGFWRDHNKPFINRIFTNAIAVLITSTSGPIFTLLRATTRPLWKRISPNGKKPRHNGEALVMIFGSISSELEDDYVTVTHVDPETAEGHEHHENHSVTEGPGYSSDDSSEAEDVEDFDGPMVKVSQHTSKNGVDAFELVSLFVVFLGVPTALIAASIVSSGLATDTIAISSSDHCGVYAEFTNSLVNFLEFEHSAEAQSASYASKCYVSGSQDNDCNKFYNQSISYSVANDSTCPFAGEVCYDSGNSSIQFSTGMKSGSILGINAASSFLFGRTMTCSPLIANEKYVKYGQFDHGVDQWEYLYGRTFDGYTWANPVQESDWEIKGYSTGVLCSAPGSDQSPFTPLEEFAAGPFPVTMMFISSHTIYHSEFRDDPVFPARRKVEFEGDYSDPDLYFNNSTQAGILGCVDQYKICKTVKGPCWDNGNISSILDGGAGDVVTEEQNVIRLLLLALDLSTACGSIQFRGAEALVAQDKIAHMQSLPLAEKQWQVEAEKLFQTSLARIQQNVYDFARGTASSFDGYHNIMPDNYRGMCELVEIPTIGWRNINFLGLLGTIIAAALMWLISRTIPINGWSNNGFLGLLGIILAPDFVKKKSPKRKRRRLGQRRLVAVLVWIYLLKPFGSKVFNAVVALGRFLERQWSHRREWSFQRVRRTAWKFIQDIHGKLEDVLGCF